MSEVWCVSVQNDLFNANPSCGDVKGSSSAHCDRSASTKNVDTMFAANVQGLSNMSLSNRPQGQRDFGYSLFSCDGLPPPLATGCSSSKATNRQSTATGLWSCSENDSGNFNLGFELANSKEFGGNCEVGDVSKNDKEKIAAAIWAQLPETNFSLSAPISKAVGAEISKQPNNNSLLHKISNSVNHPHGGFVSSGRSVLNASLQGNTQMQGNLTRPVQGAPLNVQPQIANVPSWTQSQLVTILPSGSNQIFRAPINSNPSLIQSRTALNHAILQNLAAAGQLSSAKPSHSPEMSSVTPNRPPILGNGTSVPAQTNHFSLTAPQLHSAIGQINELTVSALNQTAAMIMDRHQLESKLLHHAPEQFRCVYNELALPEPLEPISGRKETSGVDMLLAAQLRENLRINTLVRRIKNVTQIALPQTGALAFEKWTEDVRNFQAFLIKMHDRARRMHLSSTIAATLYSSNDHSQRVNDSVILANTLKDLMSSTLDARQALFQLGERAILHLSNLKKIPASRSMENNASMRLNLPNPVNPDSAQQLWRQLGQLPSHGY